MQTQNNKENLKRINLEILDKTLDLSKHPKE
jgi:hypothetical protein